MTILVVDDEQRLREMVGEVLGDAGYAVRLAPDADAAIARIQSEGPFDLVVTDVRMPGSMDGMGLARWVRANTPRTRIFVISAYAGEMPAGSLPFDAFLTKPLPLSKLRETVERLMAVTLDVMPAQAGVARGR